jgi:hypothetical protein
MEPCRAHLLTDEDRMNQIVATDVRTTLELAKAFSESKMVPDHFKKSVGDCYIAIRLADHYGMEPWMLMQEMYLIQGKPSMSGKMAIAILNHSLADPLRPEYSGEGDEREITLYGRPEGEAQSLSVKLKVKDAKTTNELWKKQPDQMLMYASARMWGRRYTPQILLGIVFDDEIDAMNPSSFMKSVNSTSSFPAQAEAPQQRPEVIDHETGEILSEPTALPKNPNEKWYDWGARLVATIRSSTGIAEVDQWLAVNNETLALCEKEAPKVRGNISNAVSQFKMDLLARGEPT